jgi:hypothetical protein
VGGGIFAGCVVAAETGGREADAADSGVSGAGTTDRGCVR